MRAASVWSLISARFISSSVLGGVASDAVGVVSIHTPESTLHNMKV